MRNLEAKRNSDSSLTPSLLNQTSEEMASIVFLKSSPAILIQSLEPLGAWRGSLLEEYVDFSVLRMRILSAKGHLFIPTKYRNWGDMYFREDRLFEQGVSHDTSFLALSFTKDSR